MPQPYQFDPSAPFAKNYWGSDAFSAGSSGVIPSPATQTNPGDTIGAGGAKAPPSATSPPVAPASWGPLNRGAPDTAQPASGNGANANTPDSGSGGFNPDFGGAIGLPNPTYSNTPTAADPYRSGAGVAGNNPNGPYTNQLPFFDGGGAVDGTNGDPTPSLDDALNTVQSALDYGRQKSGIDTGPQGAGTRGLSDTQSGDQPGVIPGGFANNWQKMRPSTNVVDERPETEVAQSEGPQPKMGPSVTPAGLIPQPVPQPYPYGPKVGMPGAPGAFGHTTGAGAVLDDTQNSFADGGDVDNPSEDGMPARPQTNQPTPQPGQVQAQQNPRSLVGYAMGSDAVTPDIAQAMETKVDPQGQMDGSTRKMLAIASAPDQQTQWGMMQHYRQKFNAYSAFARAAAQGTPQKPADPNAAAQAATAAFENIPDGTQTTFQPHQGGIVAHIKHLAGGKSVQGHDAGGMIGFDDGGDVDGDNPMNDPAAEAYQAEPATGTPGQAKGALDATGTAKGDQTTPQDTSVPMTTDQFDKFMATMPYDKVMDNGMADTLTNYVKGFQNPSQSGATPARPSTPAQPATPQSAGDPEVEAEAQRLYPWTGQAQQRTAYTAAQLGANKTQKNALELQESKNTGELAKQQEVTRMWNGPGGRTEGLNTRSANTAAERLQAAIIAATGRTADAQMSSAVNLLGQQIAADPSMASDPQKLIARVAPIAVKLNLQPAQLARMTVQSLQQPQGGVPQPGVTQPQPSDISFLRAHPDGSAKFDAKFGQGASQRALGQ